MSGNEGLISCLMVTKDRLDFMARSVGLYCRQSWENKELVVVCDGPPAAQDAVRSFLAELGREDIRGYFLPSPLTLGQLRNMSVELASGEFLCQWDDDDLNHPLRLKVQVESMLSQGADVSFMYDQLHYMSDTRELYWTDWSSRSGHLANNGIPGTLLCRRTVGVRYPESGPRASKGEDGALQIDLHRRCRVSGLRDKGYLYTYVYHGRNTWDRPHHEVIVKKMSFPGSYLVANAGKVWEYVRNYFPESPSCITAREGTVFPIRPPDVESAAAMQGRGDHARGGVNVHGEGT